MRLVVLDRRVLLVVLAALLILVPLVLTATPSPKAGKPRLSPTVLMVLAARHLNESSALALAAFEGAEVSEGEPRAIKVAVELREYASQLPSTGFGGRVARAAKAYASMAEAANHLYAAARPIAEVSETLDKVVSLLAECRVSEALELYGEVRGAVEAAVGNLTRALAAMDSVDPRDLLSEVHQRALKVARERAELALSTLVYLDKVMKVVSLDPKGVEDACREGEQCPCRVAQGLQQLLRAGAPCQCRGGGAGLGGGLYHYELKLFISRVLGLGRGQGGAGGSGAGAGYPLSDD